MFRKMLILLHAAMILAVAAMGASPEPQGDCLRAPGSTAVSVSATEPAESAEQTEESDAAKSEEPSEKGDGIIQTETDRTDSHPDYAPEIEEDPYVQYSDKAELLSVSTKKHNALRLWQGKRYLPYVSHGYMPGIIPYLIESDSPTGCVVIFPGGGYGSVTMEREGTLAAQYINEHFGMNAFVVHYRIAPNNYRAILTDALRAIRFVRFYAEVFHINPDQIAVLGFSAGGHLAMMTAEHYDYGKAGDEIDAVSSRPDAAFLCYPVGSMVSEYAHAHSRRNFFGNEDTEENRVRFSAELGFRADMPPVYIIHNADDQVVPVENSINTFLALKDAGADISYHQYETGGHGYGINCKGKLNLDWPERMNEWLVSLGFRTSAD